jgi:hypothetical protein
MFIDFNVGRTAEAAIDNVAKARKFFAEPQIIKKITEQADLVGGWMIKNKNKTGKAGDEIAGSPWWPQLSKTEDDDRLDLRLHSLRTLTFGHGFRRLLNRMVDVGLLSPAMKECIDDATEYKYMEVHYQLIGFSRADNPKDVSLTFIRDAFNLSDKTSPTKVRDGSLGHMAVLGLWEAAYNGQTSHIRAGATAKIFHDRIFTPVRQHFQKTLKGGTPLIVGIALVAAALITVLHWTQGGPAGPAVMSSKTPSALEQYASHPSDHVPT